MAEMPAPIREFIDALTDELLAPAFMLVNDDGALTEWGGALDSYGIFGLNSTTKVDEFPFLAGVLPVDAGGVFLPNVQTREEVFADIYFFHRPQGTWILFLDATADVKKRKALQQRAYDVSLRAAELEQEGKSLYDVNTMLEQRVREQTAELSQTVVRLQEELAESKRIQRALGASETRFRSLYDSNLVGVVFWDADGRVTAANDAFLRLLGYSRDDLSRGLIKWNEITRTDPKPSDHRLMEKTLDTLTFQSADKDFIRKDGKPTTLLFMTGPYEDSMKQNVGFARPTT